jgi:hypothetical protein
VSFRELREENGHKSPYTVASGYGVLPPAPAVSERLTHIPEADSKYIRFGYKVNWLQPVSDAQREKEKGDVLQDIRNSLSA